MSDPMKEFQDRVVSKIKNEIGSMVTDDVLAQLMARAVNESFFAPRKVFDGYHSREAPSWFQEEVAKHAKPMMEKAIKEYVERHSEIIGKAIAGFLETNSLAIHTTAMLMEKLNGAFSAIASRY